MPACKNTCFRSELGGHDPLANALAALTEIEHKYEEIMRDPPDWTTFTGPDDPRLVFAREAWYGASLIARKALKRSATE